MAEEEKVEYVVRCKFLKWFDKRRLKVVLDCPLFKQRFTWTKVEVQQYGYLRALTPGIIEVDRELVKEYPKIAA